MPLAVAIASVILALHEPGWWAIVGGALVTAVGRHVAWKRAAATVLPADPTGLIQASGDRLIKRVPWDDIRYVSLYPGSAVPRWSLGGKMTPGALPAVSVERRRTGWNGKPITESLGSYLILDKAAYDKPRLLWRRCATSTP